MELGSGVGERPDRPELSPRERQALDLYASGLSLAAVAARLDVTAAAARCYLDRARVKFLSTGWARIWLPWRLNLRPAQRVKDSTASRDRRRVLPIAGSRSLLDDRRMGSVDNAGEGSDRPQLSRQERQVFALYASGLPLKTVARRLGIAHGTAKSYLDRAKAKYRQAGRPVRTKIDILRVVLADGWFKEGPDLPPTARSSGS